MQRYRLTRRWLGARMAAEARRRMRAFAAVVVLLAALTSCTGGEDRSGNAARDGTMTFGDSGTFPENLFPIISAGQSTSVANILIRILPAPFRALPDYTIGVDEDLMASEPTVEQTATGQVVTYRINPAAVWSDGEPISAADFEFTWRLRRSLDPADGGCPALIDSFGYDQIASVAGGDGGKTVTVTFSSPFPDWKSLFTLFPAHVMDTGDDASNCVAVTKGWPIADGIPEEVSGGPWQLLAENINVRGQVVMLTPNPKWYGDGPRLERLVYVSIGTEPSVLVTAVKLGEVDMVIPNAQLDLVDQLRALAPEVTTQTDFGLAFEHLDLNTAKPHLAKPEVRRAFALALDRAEIVSATIGAVDDRAQVLNNRQYVNTQPEYVDTAPEQYDAQDIEGAKALLESVGYTLGADGVYVHPSDGRLQLRLSTFAKDSLRAATIEVIAAQLREAGFAIETFIDPDLFGAADKATSLESRGFDVAMYAWFSSPYVSQNAPLYQTGASLNFAGVSNAHVDALFGQLTTELDPVAAAGLANEADRLLWDEMVTIPLFQLPFIASWNSDFGGIVPNATSAGPLWNSDEIFIRH